MEKVSTQEFQRQLGRVEELIAALEGVPNPTLRGALRFENVVERKFKLIPRDARGLPHFQLTDGDWEELALPIDLAFIFYSTPHAKVRAFYPSPAGATESLLSLTAWATLVRHNPALRQMQPDVEALLIHRAGEAREYFLAPIDQCFELVGTIRVHWRGFSGGEEVWREIEKFFCGLREMAR